jgi:SAM-dependent methyltransferase
MDDLLRHSRERWNALARAGVSFSRPWDTLNEAELLRMVDPYGHMGSPAGRDVLVLAGAGGQQGPAFARLGARVTVFDLSDEMLARDRESAAKLGLAMRIMQGDMRDLSPFPNASFDIVWHAYSINFVPDPLPVFQEAARVLRPGGFYRVEFHNPFFFGMDETAWDGKGYPVRLPYVQGAEVEDATWDIWPEGADAPVKIEGPREFRHTLSTMLNGLSGQGFRLIALHEERSMDPGAAPAEGLEPGSWEHFLSVAAPWINLWMTKREEIHHKEHEDH